MEQISYAEMREHEAGTLARLAHELVSARDVWWDDKPWMTALDAHVAFWSDVEATCGSGGGGFTDELKSDLVSLASEVISLCRSLKSNRNPDACEAVLRIDVEVAEGLLGLSRAAQAGPAGDTPAAQV